MATMRHADSRRLYSWWWDSHISPKNSKWLQDNLSDMDMKIKAMIKLIEEDADSFARRAEMYYKKRPELMRLVEEFYRAYRALAERYDHATGALRQAHRTIAEAFPNQIPTFSDDFSPASSTTDAEYTLGSGDSLLDPYGSLPQFSGGKGNGIYSDDGDSWADRKGLKQMGGMFPSQDGGFFSNVSEKKIKKSLNFSDEGETTQLKSLQEKISQLTSENESLKMEVNLGSEKSSNLESQVKQLQETHSKLDSQKEEAILQFQECLRRVVELEAQIEVFRKVNADLLFKVERLNSNEEMCHLLEKENQSLTVKVDTLIKEANNLQEDHLYKKEEIEKLKSLLYHEQFRTAEAESAVKTLEQLQIQSELELKSSRLEVQHGSQLLKEMESVKKTLEEDIGRLKEENDSLCIELKQKREEMNKLNIALQNECKRSIEIEAKFQSLESLHGQSQKELKFLMLDLQSSMHDLKDVEMRKQFLVEELSKIKEDIQSLNERNTSLMTMIKSLEAKIRCLIDAQEQLENKVALQSDENNVLQRDISSMKGEINNLRLQHRTIADQMQAVGINEDSLQTSVKSLHADNLELKETCKKHEAEKLLLFERLVHMDEISEKNTALETSLSDTTVELQGLREKMVIVQQSHNALQDANTSLLYEKNNLILKVENIEGHLEELTKKNSFLECSLSDANAELEGLRGEFKNMEESYQVLYTDKCSVDVERDTLLSKVENMGISLENLKKRYEVLHDEHLLLEKEKEITRRQLIDLQDTFNQEKQDHENFKQCSNAKLAILESQISKLTERNLCQEEQFRIEHKLFDLEVERFILQRCISDLINGTLSLQDKCQELEQDNKDHKEKNMMLSSTNGKLEMEMQMILKALTKKGCNYTHGEEPHLQEILGNIRELQNSVLAAENEHLGLIFESSINDILFREVAYSAAELESNNRSLEQMYRLRTDELLGLQAERCSLLKSIKHLEQNLEASYQTEKMMKERVKILGTELLASKEAEFMLCNHNSRLVQEISSLSSQLCGLGKEKDILDEEINVVLQENVTLDCLSVMLKQFNVETSLKLEALLGDFRCTNDTKNHLVGKVKDFNEAIQVIEDENSQLKSLLLKYEEFKSHTVLLAAELSIAKYVNNELNSQIHQKNLQIENTEKLLTEKEETLLEVCMILQKLQNVEEKLLCNLKDTKLELDNAKCTKDSLVKKISILSESIISKDNDLARSLEANAALVLELAKLQKENEELKINSSNLHKDINSCEDEVTTLLNEFQIATVHAAVCEDKLLELMGDYENVAVNNMVLSRAVDNEIALRDAHIEKLNMEVYDLKGQNSVMKAELDDYLPVMGSLQRSLCALESFIISSQKDGNMKAFKIDTSYDQHHSNFSDKPKGIVELEKLQKKVESVREMLGHYMVPYVVHSLDPTGKNYSDQKKAQEEKLIKPEEYGTVDVIEQVDKTEEPENGLQHSQISSNNDNLIMKDIQLDHASSPPKPERGTTSYKIVGNNVMQTDDRLLELWKTDEWDHESNSGKAPEGSWNYTRHDGEGGRNVHPSSELVVEKELGVDKLAMPKRNKENRQDWNKVLERLSSDAQRLTALETGVLELKNKVETSVKMCPKNYEYDDIRGQLQEAEENILQLVDMNKKLIEKAEVSSKDSVESEPMNQRWRQVSGRARRGSEKIGRLELELQKLQYIFLKLKELDNQKMSAADRRSSVLLRDYLYGSNQSRKKNLYLCCFKPKTKGH